MSEPRYEEYGTPLCSVRENRKLILENCPTEEIEAQLRAANFERDGTRFVKKRRRLRRRTNGETASGSGSDSNSDSDSTSLHVLSVRVVGDSLHVEPSDVVGIVRLVPGTSVQIDPKIGWDHVIEMLLTIQGIDRTESYYGVPLDELLSSDVEATRLIAILAINYVHGVRTIARKGFTREMRVRRREGFDGLGSVDVERTLLNNATGNPEPAWIETDIEYTNPVNGAIHMAGKVLLRLLGQDHGGEHPRRDVLLSTVHGEVGRIERTGVESSQRRIGEYRRLSMGDLPRQRHYYQRAFHTAQSVLASTLLGRPGGGPEELLVDYALSMNALFQEYSHRVLDRALREIEGIDRLGQLADVEYEAERRIRPFVGNNEIVHIPDHVLVDGEAVLSVLDSKYYREGENPAADSGPRSRMFAYAYLTGTDRMAFLCPGYHRDRLSVDDIGAELDVLSPDEDFSCKGYERLLREYTIETLALRYPSLHVFDAVEKGRLCLSGTSEEDLSQVYDTSGPFGIGNPRTFADKVVSAIAFSSDGPNKSAMKNRGTWAKNRIEDACTKTDGDGHRLYPQHETTCVPVYEPDETESQGAGTVTLYFLRSRPEGPSVATEGPRPL
jgi:hypothetical protein